MSEITPETPVAATPPTPKNVAEMLTETDNDFHDGNNWKPGLYAEGNVVHIRITPYSEPDEDDLDDEAVKLDDVHFCAVVAPVPAHAVAGKPVKLPADLACELAYGNPGDDMEGWTVVANDYIDKTRWTSTHRLVIRNEQGEHFMDTYRRGLTESQETSPYENEAQATFTPVAPSFKVVTTWKAAKSEQGGGAA
jgi:hypothetical protein